MPKQESCETELAENMQQILLFKNAKDNIKLNKIAQAINYINEANKIFNKFDNKSECKTLTEILENLVDEFKK